jgi:hypothetical protein
MKPIKKVMASLKKKADDTMCPGLSCSRCSAAVDPYRDATVKHFMAINPVLGEDAWKSWVTEIREKLCEKY